MRGRLICKFLAELARLNTQGTANASGYDPDFRTTKVTYPGGVRTSSRVELPSVKLPCQVEDNLWGTQRQTAAGNAPDTKLVLVFHFRDLERLSLVDPATGDALIRVNDRLVGIYDYNTQALIQIVRPDTQVFATEVKPVFGLGMKRNLLIVTFDERSKGLTT